MAFLHLADAPAAEVALQGLALERDEGRFLQRLAEWSPDVETPELLPDLRGHLNEIQRQFIDIRIEFLSEQERHRRLSEAERREYGELLVKSHTFRQV